MTEIKAFIKKVVTQGQLPNIAKKTLLETQILLMSDRMNKIQAEIRVILQENKRALPPSLIYSSSHFRESSL